MSHITDIILVTRCCYGDDYDREATAIDVLQQALDCVLIRVDERAGGDRLMQCDVYLAAVSHLNIDAFIRLFKAAPWHDPDCVQLMLKDEEDLIFTVYIVE
jgi:hypothetical protein